MNRQQREREYWNEAVHSADVRTDYIAGTNLTDQDCVAAILNTTEIHHAPKKARMLEIGCGVGRLMLPMSVFASELYGIDVSEEMLKMCNSAIRKWPLKNMTVGLCDGVSLPVKDNTMDFIYSMLVFQHLELASVVCYLTESARVLKKDGILRFQFVEYAEEAEFSKPIPAEAMIAMVNAVEGLKTTVYQAGIINKEWGWITAVKL